MRFVINTNYNRDAAGRVVLGGFEKRLIAQGIALVQNDWDTYHAYDVALFMAPDSKVREAKKQNAKILCGIFDPKVTHAWQIAEIRSADFLVVSSIEQREFFLKYNSTIFIYYMFPDIASIRKEHVQKEKILIGYHGNKQHLVAMKDVSKALDMLALKYDIELVAIYNIKKLGKWRENAPRSCPVRHVQWVENDFVKELSVCDIGISPAALPVSIFARFLDRPILSLLLNSVGYNVHDYMVRFKYSNNPGRLYVFGKLDIPIVTDFTPSSCQMVEDGKSGLLVGTKEGWYYALEKLILDAGLRNTLKDNYRAQIESIYSIDKTFEEFMKFISVLYKKK